MHMKYACCTNKEFIIINLMILLLGLLCYHVPNFICLSETWYNDSLPPAILPNYKMHSVPLAKEMGCGVCIFVKNDISFDSIKFV